MKRQRYISGLVAIILSSVVYTLLMFLGLSYELPHRLKPSGACPGIFIKDEAGLFTDTLKIEKSLEGFMDETGIYPVIYTLPEREMTSKAGNIVDFTADLYDREINDARHFLVLFLEAPDRSLNMWAVQGNMADVLITYDMRRGFTKDALSYIDEGEDAEDALIKAADILTAKAEERLTLNFWQIMFQLVLPTVFTALICLALALSYRKVYGQGRKRRKGCGNNLRSLI